MTLHPSYIGCDISKHHLDLYDLKTKKKDTIANTVDAIHTFFKKLKRRKIFVVLEATGAADRMLRTTLHALGIPYARVNSTRARRFAQSTGQIAKTDQLDAKMLADLGERLQPEAEPALDYDRERLAQLALRRDQLVDMRATEQGRKKEVCEPLARKSLHRHIEMLSEEIAEIERAIDDLIAASENLTTTQTLLKTAKGVGPVTSLTLLALMPELGQTSPKQIAALAGLAPYDNQSGLYKGQRRIAGGRRRVRRALYMAALTATRSNERLRAFYRSLLDKGKPKKVALIAAARKLLTWLNAMIRDQVPYRE